MPHSASDVVALYADVYADPDADGPRAVLADALQELGDPRGELISLQLQERAGNSPELGARVQALVAEHGESWLGPLRAITYRGHLRRGFLQRLELASAGHATAAEWAELAAHPMLATVEELVAARATGAAYAAMLAGTAMTVRAIQAFDPATWRVVSAMAMPRLRSLEIPTWKRMPYSQAFSTLVAPWLLEHPEVVRVGLWSDAVDATPPVVLSRLTALHLVVGTLESVVALWRRYPNLERIRFYNDRCELVRDGAGCRMECFSHLFHGISSRLGQLPPEIQRIEVASERFAKELVRDHGARFAIVVRPPPSGAFTVQR